MKYHMVSVLKFYELVILNFSQFYIFTNGLPLGCNGNSTGHYFFAVAIDTNHLCQ